MEIVNALKIELLKKEEEVIVKNYTAGTEAYELFLLGMHSMSGNFTVEAFHTGSEYLKKRMKKILNLLSLI